eukprot:TRINITY_DN42421_c0_g1_i2.p1 TRINITY_DN42421_c0_g1~~TRINITY_DN42421_c0_g1_i2.p1  ORF type:complete len:176 (+),score=18.40 TRINITY_DN42421_c0_g1_i2:48-575(+)
MQPSHRAFLHDMIDSSYDFVVEVDFTLTGDSAAATVRSSGVLVAEKVVVTSYHQLHLPWSKGRAGDISTITVTFHLGTRIQQKIKGAPFDTEDEIRQQAVAKAYNIPASNQIGARKYPERVLVSEEHQNENASKLGPFDSGIEVGDGDNDHAQVIGDLFLIQLIQPLWHPANSRK